MAPCQTSFKEDRSPLRPQTETKQDEKTFDTIRKGRDDEFVKRLSGSSTSTNSSATISVIHELSVNDEEDKMPTGRNIRKSHNKKSHPKTNTKHTSITHESSISPRRSRRSKSADSSPRGEKPRSNSSERFHLLCRVHSDNDRFSGRKNLDSDIGDTHSRPIIDVKGSENSTIKSKSPRRTTKRCSFASEEHEMAQLPSNKAKASYSSPKKSFGKFFEGPLGSLSGTHFDVDKPGSPMRESKRTDASTVQTEQPGLTEEQNAWAGIDRLLASYGASIETRDVLPCAILRALHNDKSSCHHASQGQEMSSIKEVSSSPTKAVSTKKKRPKTSQTRQVGNKEENKERLLSLSLGEEKRDTNCEHPIDVALRADRGDEGQSRYRQAPPNVVRKLTIADELSLLTEENQVRPTDIFNNSMPSLMTRGSKEMFEFQDIQDTSPKWASCSDINYFHEADERENDEILDVESESPDESCASDLDDCVRENFDEYAFYYGENENKAFCNQALGGKHATSQSIKRNGSTVGTRKSHSICKSQATRAKQKVPKRVQRLESARSKEKRHKNKTMKKKSKNDITVKLSASVLATNSPSSLNYVMKPEQSKDNDSTSLLQVISPRRILKSSFGSVSRFIYLPKSHQRYRNKERTFRLLSTHLPTVSLFGRKVNSDSPKIIDTGCYEAQFYPDHSDQDDFSLRELLQR